MPRLRPAVCCFAASLLLGAAPAAQGQLLHRCVDARGKTYYPEHPTGKCRPVGGTQFSRPAPPPPAAKAGAKAGAKSRKPPAKKAPVMTAEERARAASRCKSLREQLAYLKSPRGSKVAAHSERVGQVEVALRACP